MTERHLAAIYEAFRLDEESRDRELVVMTAVDQGIVTHADLTDLD